MKREALKSNPKTEVSETRTALGAAYRGIQNFYQPKAGDTFHSVDGKRLRVVEDFDVPSAIDMDKIHDVKKSCYAEDKTKPSEPQIASWINQLINQSERIHKLSCELEARLGPQILRNSDPEDNGDGIEQSLVGLASNMRTIYRQFDIAENNIRSIIDRLEL